MKRILEAAVAAVLALTFVPTAFAHATIEPAEVAPHARADFTLRVDEEVAGARTTRVELTVPDGFSIQARASETGWTSSVAGRIVVWTGSGEPVFRFTATPGAAGDYAFAVRQDYSDGSVMGWSGDQGSETPAALVQVSEGALSTLAIVVLVVGGVAILAGVVALLARNRSLA